MNPERWQVFLQMQCRNGSRIAHSMSKDALEDVEKAIEKVEHPQQVLIVGTGTGKELELMIERGVNVRALSLCPKEKEQLDNELQKYVDVGDIHHTHYEPERFQLIFARQTIEHLLSPYIALMEMRRIIVNNGQVFITTPASDSDFSDYHLYTFTANQWRELFRKVGFHIDKVVQIPRQLGLTMKFFLRKIDLNPDSIHAWAEANAR